MGSKKTNKYVLFSAQAVTGTNTYTSATQDIQNLDNLFLQVRFTGTMTGTLTVSASADGKSDGVAPTILWDDFVFNPPLAQPAGSAVSYSIALNQIPAGYFKVTYVNASGSGTLQVNYFIKDLN